MEELLGEDFALEESHELQQFNPSYIQPMNLENVIYLDDYSQCIGPNHPP